MKRSFSNILLAVLVGLIVVGGIKRIGAFASRLVPGMILLYGGTALVIICLHAEAVWPALSLVFSDAFTGEAVAGGALGTVIVTGVRRAAFSNEAGMGSTPNAAATAEVNHPAAQGLVQSFGVIVDTLIICSCTAVVILLSGVYDKMLATQTGSDSMQGIQLTQDAMADHLGSFGVGFIAVAIFFFAYTSILANFAYTEINIDYLFGDLGDKAIAWIRPFLLAMVFIGSVATLSFVVLLHAVATAIEVTTYFAASRSSSAFSSG